MKRKYKTLLLTTAIVVLLTTGGFITISKTNKAVHHISKEGFVVVELFTSEGCSSCPSADQTVARLLAKNIENVYILAYHVDYWDRLGWKDPFSKAAYSERQNQYASVFDLGSVYTPQVIVNGSSQFVGSDEGKLTAIVEENLLKEPLRHITIDQKRSGNGITINYDIDGDDAVLLNLALVQPEATTSVKRGENGGRTLHHVNIVRELKTIDAKGIGKITIEIPKELIGNPLEVIAFTQEKNTLKILGADKKESL